MATAGRGVVSFLGMAAESVWGTLVSRTSFVRLKNEDLKEQLPRNFPGPHSGSRSRLVSVAGGKYVDGGVSIGANYHGIGLLLKHLFGDVSSAQQGGTAAYLHTFDLTDALPVGLSLEVDRDISSYAYSGCKVARAEFRQPVNDELEMRFDFLGKEETKISATTETFPAIDPIVYPHLTMELDDTAAAIKEWSLTVDNQLQGTDRVDTGSGGFIKEPIPGQRLVSGRWTAEFDSVAQRDKFLAASAVKLEFLYVGDIIASTYTDWLKFIINVGYMTAGRTNVEDANGVVQQEFSFEAIYDAATPADELQVTLQNEDTSI